MIGSTDSKIGIGAALEIGVGVDFSLSQANRALAETNSDLKALFGLLQQSFSTSVPMTFRIQMPPVFTPKRQQ